MPITSSGDPLEIEFALDRLNDVLPARRMVVTDGGRFLLAAYRRISIEAPEHFLVTHHFGSIGLGMGYAIGAGSAASDRPVVLITGDGGFMLGGLAEFNTAVRAGLDLIVVVCNDGSYGAEHVQFRKRSMDPSLSLLSWPEFAPLATALGGTGVCIRSTDDLPLAAEAIAQRNKPLLIDLKLDPDQIPTWH